MLSMNQIIQNIGSNEKKTTQEQISKVLLINQQHQQSKNGLGIEMNDNKINTMTTMTTSPVAVKDNSYVVESTVNGNSTKNTDGSGGSPDFGGLKKRSSARLATTSSSKAKINKSFRRFTSDSNVLRKSGNTTMTNGNSFVIDLTKDLLFEQRRLSDSVLDETANNKSNGNKTDIDKTDHSKNKDNSQSSGNFNYEEQNSIDLTELSDAPVGGKKDDVVVIEDLDLDTDFDDDIDHGNYDRLDLEPIEDVSLKRHLNQLKDMLFGKMHFMNKTSSITSHPPSILGQIFNSSSSSQSSRTKNTITINNSNNQNYNFISVSSSHFPASTSKKIISPSNNSTTASKINFPKTPKTSTNQSEKAIYNNTQVSSATQKNKVVNESAKSNPSQSTKVNQTSIMSKAGKASTITPQRINSSSASASDKTVTVAELSMDTNPSTPATSTTPITPALVHPSSSLGISPPPTLTVTAEILVAEVSAAKINMQTPITSSKLTKRTSSNLRKIQSTNKMKSRESSAAKTSTTTVTNTNNTTTTNKNTTSKANTVKITKIPSSSNKIASVNFDTVDRKALVKPDMVQQHLPFTNSAQKDRKKSRKTVNTYTITINTKDSKKNKPTTATTPSKLSSQTTALSCNAIKDNDTTNQKSKSRPIVPDKMAQSKSDVPNTSNPMEAKIRATLISSKKRSSSSTEPIQNKKVKTASTKQPIPVVAAKTSVEEQSKSKIEEKPPLLNTGVKSETTEDFFLKNLLFPESASSKDADLEKEKKYLSKRSGNSNFTSGEIIALVNPFSRCTPDSEEDVFGLSSSNSSVSLNESDSKSTSPINPVEIAIEFLKEEKQKLASSHASPSSTSAAVKLDDLSIVDETRQSQKEVIYSPEPIEVEDVISTRRSLRATKKEAALARKVVFKPASPSELTAVAHHLRRKRKSFTSKMRKRLEVLFEKHVFFTLSNTVRDVRDRIVYTNKMSQMEVPLHDSSTSIASDSSFSYTQSNTSLTRLNSSEKKIVYSTKTEPLRTNYLNCLHRRELCSNKSDSTDLIRTIDCQWKLVNKMAHHGMHTNELCFSPMMQDTLEYPVLVWGNVIDEVSERTHGNLGHFNFENGKMKILDGHVSAQNVKLSNSDVKFTSKGDCFLTCSHSDSMIKVWESETGQFVHAFDSKCSTAPRGENNRCSGINGLALTASRHGCISTDLFAAAQSDGNVFILSRANDQAARYWRTASLELPNNRKAYGITALTFSKDHRILYGSYESNSTSAPNSGKVHVWDVEHSVSGPMHSSDFNDACASFLALSPSGDRLAVAKEYDYSDRDDFNFALVDPRDWDRPSKVRCRQMDQNLVGWSPCGGYVYSAATDDTLKYFDLRNLKLPLHTLRHSYNGITDDLAGIRSVLWLSSNLLLTCGNDEKLRVWDPWRASPFVTTLPSTQGDSLDSPIWSMNISQDGQFLAAGTSLSIYLWTLDDIERWPQLQLRT